MASVLIDNRGILQTLDGSGTSITGNLTVTGDVVITGELSGQKKNTIVSTATLSLSDSGAVILASGSSAQTYTLPTIATAAGFNVTFHAASPHAHVITGSNIQGALYHNTNGTTLARQAVSNRGNITLNSTNPAIGDYMTIICDGTNYYVHGWLNNSASLA
jgi:hypothetical protein